MAYYAIGIFTDNNPRKQNLQANEFLCEDLESAIQQAVLLNEYDVPCYVAEGNDREELEIRYRNNSLIKLEQEQELYAIKSVGF